MRNGRLTMITIITIVAFAHLPRRFATTGRIIYYKFIIIISSGWRPTCGRVFSIMYNIIAQSRIRTRHHQFARAQSIRPKIAVNDRETDLDVMWPWCITVSRPKRFQYRPRQAYIQCTFIHTHIYMYT